MRLPGKGLPRPLDGLDPRVRHIPAPYGEEFPGLLAVRLLPEESRLFFHGVNLKKRTVCAGKGVKLGFAVEFNQDVEIPVAIGTGVGGANKSQIRSEPCEKLKES